VSKGPGSYRLLVLCPFPEGVAAGQRLKYEQYFADWRKSGFAVDVSPYMDLTTWHVAYERGRHARKLSGLLKGHARRMRDLLRLHRYDIVYIHMWVTPFGTTLFERLVRRLVKHVIFDLEDNIMIGQPDAATDHPNPILRLLKGPNKARYLIARSDHVITSSPFLNDFCRQISGRANCTYISSSVDTERFVPANSYGNDRPLTVGWTGTFSSKPYLDLLREVFQELATRVAFRLKVIGNFDYVLPGVDLEVVRWTKEKEVSDLQSIDIGVYPLPTDDWVLGKSGLKAIQYMAFGLPTVATAVGTTPMIVRHRVNGLLVKTREEWVNALESLINSAELRRELGIAARHSAVSNYSIKAIAKQYREVLTAAVHDGGQN
jgi:glycosyltransferase involved in cell wall biosynthesis